MRYYWPDPEVEAAVARLFDNLSALQIPLPLVSQYLPEQYARIRAGQLAATAHELTVDRVRDALRPYAAATGPEGARDEAAAAPADQATDEETSEVRESTHV